MRRGLYDQKRISQLLGRKSSPPPELIQRAAPEAGAEPTEAEARLEMLSLADARVQGKLPPHKPAAEDTWARAPHLGAIRVSAETPPGVQVPLLLPPPPPLSLSSALCRSPSRSLALLRSPSPPPFPLARGDARAEARQEGASGAERRRARRSSSPRGTGCTRTPPPALPY